MDKLTKLYQTLQEENIYLSNYSIPKYKAATISMNGKCGIFVDYSKIDTLAEELCVVAHEMGHCATGSTHSLSSHFELLSKHEYKANKWQVHKIISIEEYKDAISAGCTSFYELSEYFDLPEHFIQLVDYIYTCEGKL